MSHYFTTPPEPMQDELGSVQLKVDGVDVPLFTAPGVFSRQRIDPGTMQLLAHAPAPAPGQRVLDLGCGYGPIAVWAATRAPTSLVWAVDVNDRAIELCTRNCAAAGVVERVWVGRPERVPADARFDLIYSNPAIRIGKPALHKMLRHWLARLAPEGQAYVVVAKSLGSDSLQAWLRAEGWDARRHAAAGGYRVLVCPPSAL